MINEDETELKINFRSQILCSHNEWSQQSTVVYVQIQTSLLQFLGKMCNKSLNKYVHSFIQNN